MSHDSRNRNPQEMSSMGFADLPDKAEVDNSQELLRRMAADANDVVDVVIPFASEDVPRYLDNLRRFHQESRKAEILVK